MLTAKQHRYTIVLTKRTKLALLFICILIHLLMFFFKLDRENKIAGVIPRVLFTDKSTYVKSSTKIYDDVSSQICHLFLVFYSETKQNNFFQRTITHYFCCCVVFSQMAFKYLSWLLYPLFGCYAIYSLLYVEHKGWYSWVLSMLYGFLLTFGELGFFFLHINISQDI